MTAFAIPNQRGRRDDGVRFMTGRHRRRHRGGFGPEYAFGRRAGRGDIRAAILALLAEQPMHGYQIIQELAERTGGVWRPSPGSVYPTLQQLEDEELVREAASDSGKRVYELTDAGREQAASAPAPWTAVAARATTHSSRFATSRSRCSRQPARLPTQVPRPSSRRRRRCSATPAAACTGCWPRRTSRGAGSDPPRPSRPQSIACFARKTPSGSTSARISARRP